MKIKKKNVFWGVGGFGRRGGGRVGGIRVDVNGELKFLGKFTNKIGGVGWGRRGDQVGGQGGCERRIEVYVKIQKKKLGGGGRGLVGGEGLGRGSGWGGGSGWI